MYNRFRNNKLLRALSLVTLSSLIGRGSTIALYQIIALSLKSEVSSNYILLLVSIGVYSSVANISSGIYLGRKILSDSDSVTPLKIGNIILIVIFASAILAFTFQNEFKLQTYTNSTELIYKIILLTTIFSAAALGDVCNTIQNITGRYSANALTQVICAILNTIVASVIFFGDMNQDLPILMLPIATALVQLLVFLRNNDKVLSLETSAIEFKSLLKYVSPLIISNMAVNPIVIFVIHYNNNLDSQSLVVVLMSLNYIGFIMALPGILSTASLSFIFGSNRDNEDKSVSSFLVFSTISTTIIYILTMGALFYMKDLYPEKFFYIKIQTVILVSSVLPFSYFIITSNKYLASGRSIEIMFANVTFSIPLIIYSVCSMFLSLGVTSLAVSICLAHWARASYLFAKQ